MHYTSTAMNDGNCLAIHRGSAIGRSERDWRRGYGSCNPERQGGFSAIELMIVVAIAAILLTIAAPSFSALMANLRLTTAADNLLGTIALARSEAIKRNVPIGVCASNDNSTCLTAGNNSWQSGYIVFVDDTAPTGQHQAAELLIRAIEGVPPDLVLTSTGFTNGSYLMFLPTGGVSGASVGSLTLCSHTLSKKIAMNISALGRPERTSSSGSC